MRTVSTVSMRNSQRNTTGRRLLCLLLCMTTWRGPVVWLHSHSDHEANAAADIRLSSHLRRFHHESPRAHESSRWHLHIGLLRDFMTDCDDEAPDPSSRPSMEEPICLSVAPAIAVPALAGMDLSFDVIWIAASLAQSARSAPPPVPRGSFLQTYGTAPLRALTCVIRC